MDAPAAEKLSITLPAEMARLIRAALRPVRRCGSVKVVLTAAALEDLAEIGEYIAQGNPLRAASFVEELLAHCERLGTQSLRHLPVPRYEVHGIRRCARDYEPLLFPKG